ncbi:competence/damage-inducible protein A [Amycolatopsis rubida]|uniref:Molybdenum cofactor synthesis domain-containing protein n=1 Tax=Amycolatopsis rubida TaxID=112413 RepID=A0A1I6AGW5_9PSEU|nr:competence/damage-inducible protein A [Amycolatopsis rubida]SFQ67956.1 molybdenum cofactor synthesis domain-containing protein [Amycolatopsis rubida]
MTGSAAIVVIGDEVLEGSTTDTNSSWLCRQVSGRGSRVVQVCAVPDDRERICAALTDSFSLGANLVLTSGGLGPTRDDLTAAAIAGYAGVPVRLNETARELVEQRYAELARAEAAEAVPSDETLRARTKMALLPEGAEAVPNEIGVAPAIHLVVAAGCILALPGVPGELKYIVTHRGGHILQRRLGIGHLRCATIVTSTQEEASLAGALHDFDSCGIGDVYLKSRARKFGRNVRVTVTLSVRGTDPGQVQHLLEHSLTLLGKTLSRRGIEVTEVTFDHPEPMHHEGRT